ncbi:hypothetical protein BO83DRAFT_449849 [Aspergillus eucalypticola CBS 122712]|uniref:Uncharacterized protein n=1 Tax=Aspergillus eucalypticola (strain CBS 122712 / IBT 29274) TaxID=1448314 RepID=A0A317WD71_ASPEC|nr:uncharacterized protein BO83DRAFT_449849 [Aspergillus eucalypticola CBS 122712]PWY84313.1 hypothetical protein BO83DRAFT_449849 [Aspergillus eucalypticola CBS 122712]
MTSQIISRKITTQDVPPKHLSAHHNNRQRPPNGSIAPHHLHPSIPPLLSQLPHRRNHLFAVGVCIMTGTRDLFYKVMWTLVFCPLGMGGAMGGLINCFIVDHYYGKKAAHFTGILSLLVLSACNYLCYNLYRHFGWFGANEHLMWFHWRYPMIWTVDYCNGLLMFTDRGQERLARLGL